MISTGVQCLDPRLGGLTPGGVYAFLGPRASGKSVLGLHFLADGLARDEHCVLITSDEAAMIESRAAYIGYTGTRLTDHPRLQILKLSDARAGSLGPGLSLTSRLRWLRPARVVIEGIERSPEYQRTPHAVATDLIKLMGETGATVYLMLQPDGSSPDAHPAHELLLERATGVFRLDITELGERTFHFEREPAGTFRKDSFPYALKPGAGFTEEMPLTVPDLTPEQKRRLIILDELGAAGPDLFSLLDRSFDVQVVRNTVGNLGTLAGGRYGALVLTVDPYDPARASDLVFTLRRGGNAAPMVCLAPSRGLRSTTRSRCLQSGADDFFIAELPAADMAERIHTAWLRGAHRRTGLSQIGQIMQPMGSDGALRPMTEPELRQALDTLLAEHPPLFFCYVEFCVGATAPHIVWPALRGKMRVGDGDIIGMLSGGRFVCVLDRITPDQTTRVVERIKNAHPALAVIRDVKVIASPTQTAELREHLAVAREDVTPLMVRA